MEELTTNVELDDEVLVDIDVLTDNSYLLLTNKGRVVSPFHKIKILRTFKFPLIRRLTSDLFLIADSRTDKTDNCFIYDLQGNGLRQFYAGEGIQDIEVHRNRIIITYFDESIYGKQGPNNGGLVMFDFAGNILFKYNEKHGDQIISDCYCICKHGANRILFLPYNSFLLTELNLDTGEEQKYELPEQLKGSTGLTSTADHILFHSPYKDKAGIYKWRTGSTTAKKIAEYGTELRGLKNGRFLSKGQKGFTILDLN